MHAVGTQDSQRIESCAQWSDDFSLETSRELTDRLMFEPFAIKVKVKVKVRALLPRFFQLKAPTPTMH